MPSFYTRLTTGAARDIKEERTRRWRGGNHGSQQVLGVLPPAKKDLIMDVPYAERKPAIYGVRLSSGETRVADRLPWHAHFPFLILGSEHIDESDDHTSSIEAKSSAEGLRALSFALQSRVTSQGRSAGAERATSACSSVAK